MDGKETAASDKRSKANGQPRTEDRNIVDNWALDVETCKR